MKDSNEPQTQSLPGLRTLTDYHWQRRKAALEEAEEMLKHPYSLEQALAQVAEQKAMRQQEMEEQARKPY